MKEYKLVHLNKGLSFTRERDLEQSQYIINDYVSNGWELQQIISQNDISGVLVGVFYKEE